MKRLTTKSELKRSDGQIIEVMYSYGYRSRKDMTYHAIAGNDAIDKLGQLEDIEEDLGIDLLTMFKALNNGFYTKNSHYSGYGIGVNIIQKCLLWNERFQNDIYYFKDYGKTWALTREELE